MENRLPVGPGSRGGQWHDPQYRRDYHRNWRASHPEYREREASRKYRARAAAAGRPVVLLTDAIAHVITEEATRHGVRAVGRRLLVHHAQILRITKHAYSPGIETTNAVIATYGMKRVLQAFATLRRQPTNA